MTNKFTRVICINPATRGFAYAVLESADDLVDWGLVHALVPSDANVLSRVDAILTRSRADLLVLEDGRGTRRRERAQRLISKIGTLAKERELRVFRVSRSRVKEVLSPAKTKQEIAEAIANSYPALSPRLPRRRKPWEGEDSRMKIFDAVAFALAAIS